MYHRHMLSMLTSELMPVNTSTSTFLSTKLKEIILSAGLFRSPRDWSDSEELAAAGNVDSVGWVVVVDTMGPIFVLPSAKLSINASFISL